MPKTIAARADGRQATTVSRDEIRTTDVDLSAFVEMVRLAIHRQGWGPESLSAEDAMNMSKGYISRVLNGEKPLTIPFLLCLPADVQEAVVAAWAQRKGLIVLKAISENVTLHGVVASALAKVFGRQ